MSFPSRLKWILTICLVLFVLFGSFSTIQCGAALIIADVEATYAAKCAKCHGADGKGVEKYKKKGQKDFTDAAWQKSRNDAQLTESIKNGKGDFMPPWKGKLSADEMKGLVDHIRNFGKKK